MTDLKTTRPIIEVRSIADVQAIEAQDYRALVTARGIYDLLRATAHHGGARPALTVLRSPDPQDIGRALSHAQLLGAVTRAANMFRSLGLAQDRGVAAFLSPTLPQFPELLLGAQVAGVASTLNYLLSRDAIVDLLNAEAARILVIPAAHLDADCWARAEAIRADVPSLEHVLVIGAQGALPEGFRALDPLLEAACAARLDFAPTTDPDAVSALFHTGGTTGRPKLVPLSHGNQIHAAFGFGQVFGYCETDCVLNGFPFFHVGGTMTVGLAVLAAGGHMVIPSPYALRPREVVQNYWRLAEAFGATVVSGVPTSIAALSATYPQDLRLDALRMAVTGGAGLPESVAEAFERKIGVRLYETYGMTETAAAIAFTPRRGDPVRGSVGLRAPFSQTRIMQSGAPDTPCLAGVSGEVQLRGPQVFAGYVDPAHNSGVLDADGWLSTGDIGYLTADERLVLTGRAKDLIVRSGHNIDPTAIEEVANRHPDVETSAAVGMPDQYAGEVPALFVVAAQGRAVDIRALHEMLEAQLHEPPARPKRIIVIDALPLTAVGKLFKPALRERAILEKLRLEIAQHCGPATVFEAEVGTDAQGRTAVTATVTVASTEADAGTETDADTGTDTAAQQAEALRAALAPLPQSYALTVEPPRVRLQVEGGIATLTLDHPQSLNAASRAMMRGLEVRLRQLAALPDLRAVIITGAGRAFCAGGDLIEFAAARDAGGSALIDTLAHNQRVISLIEELPVPVIGAANGIAVAGGLEMLLCCDMVIAAQTARLGDGHARYGIVPAGGASLRLPERIGAARAAQLFYTAEMISAETALTWGLVCEVAAPEDLMERARAKAAQIAANSPEVIRQMKRLSMAQAQDPARRARLTAEITAFQDHLNGADLAEGLRAFAQKRAPDWPRDKTR